MTLTEISHLLVGGGCAAVTAASTLRLEDASDSVMIVSADECPPYYRPALSKQCWETCPRKRFFSIPKASTASSG